MSISEVKVCSATMAAVSEIDSFYFKFRNLLISGQSANLTLRSEAGKASLSLTVKVELPRHVQASQHARSRHSRERRRERKAAAREADASPGAVEIAVNEAEADVNAD